MSRPVRIGIDVGGTFTHAVAIDVETLDIVGRSKVPTTHTAAEGVARGIIQSIDVLLKDNGITPEAVTFIAHSTTQATNALLEGDVAPVGIIGMGKRSEAFFSRAGTNIKPIELAPGKFLQTYFEFVDTTNGVSRTAIESALSKLTAAGAKAIAVSEAFSVDDSAHEDEVLSIVRASGMPATSGSEVSKLYGLKVRTRTAVINAAMLPKMIETANMTEDSVRKAGITAPVMIMRSDGGVMDIAAMRQRPILTLLSGPAAGVAAAMMYLNISDGIFLEVGGTSTDISVIRNGKALVKAAEIGGHRVYMRTLDVKTVGVAGGSMIRSRNKEIVDVGPRSAHIAGVGYVSFNPPVDNPSFVAVKPKPSDPDDYLAIATAPGSPPSLCLTPTCAANFLGLVPAGDCAQGNTEAVTAAFTALGKHFNADPKSLAETVLRFAYQKCLPVIDQFISDYKLDRGALSLIGGGGGAAAIVPFVAKQFGSTEAIAQNADVISAIGVALALLRETVERNVVQPKPDDILRIREEAFQAVHRMGADPASIEIHVEVDPRANIVRATAYGAAKLNQPGQTGQTLTEPERVQLAAKSMRVEPGAVRILAKTEHFEVFASNTTEKRLFGLLPRKVQALRTLDEKGIIRLQTRNGVVLKSTAAEADRAAVDLAEEHAQYGDAGKIIPDVMLLAGARIVDLSGIADPAQLGALARTELGSMPPESPTIIIASIS